jgi:hypothetical protein
MKKIGPNRKNAERTDWYAVGRIGRGANTHLLRVTTDPSGKIVDVMNLCSCGNGYHYRASTVDRNAAVTPQNVTCTHCHKFQGAFEAEEAD